MAKGQAAMQPFAVAARGIAADAITEEVLQQHDQDHYGGTAATDRLLVEAAVRAEDVVLDVCSGMGGPARYMAWKTGCDVTGLDITASRVEGATELTRAAGLSDSVRFVHGNALAMPFQDASFTLAIAQESLAHIPDILHRGNLSIQDMQRLFEGMTSSDIATVEGYAEQQRLCGMEVVRLVDSHGGVDAYPGRAARDVPPAGVADRGAPWARAL